MRTTSLILLGLALSACIPESEVTYTDIGTACVSGEVDTPHTVAVDFYQCLSSSCDTVTESMCEVTLDGTTLTVTASATVVSKGRACTDDCGQVLVTCETPALAAGTYDLVYGDQQTTLTVPAADPGSEACVGSPE